MRILFSFLSLVTVSCVNSQISNEFEVEFIGDKTEIPIQYRSGANPVIEVKVNGAGPFKFMFDTGSPELLKLDERVFNMLHTPVIDSVLAGDGSGRNNRSYPVTMVNTAELGNFKILNSRAMVRNYNSRPGIDSIDGVVGPVFFSGYLVELNFERNLLIITKGALSEGDSQVYPMRLKNGVPGMNVKLGSKEIDAHFDTGNMGSFTLPESKVEQSDMVGQPRVVGQARTVSNTFEIKEIQVNPTLLVGNIAFEKPVLILNDMMPQANMGVRMLRQMNLTFDLKNKLVKLVKFEPKESGSNALSEYAGSYAGDRLITVDANAQLYIQRPGGMRLKMVLIKPDTYTVEKAPGAEMKFERDSSGKIVAVNVTRGDGKWERAARL